MDPLNLVSLCIRMLRVSHSALGGEELIAQLEKKIFDFWQSCQCGLLTNGGQLMCFRKCSLVAIESSVKEIRIL